jgi:hypothetical protein
MKKIRYQLLSSIKQLHMGDWEENFFILKRGSMRKLYILTLIVALVFSFSSMSFADDAEEFDSYVAYQNVQHRTYWSAKNKLSRKIWRLTLGIDDDVYPGNVTDPGGFPGGFDELLSNIDSITISFQTTIGNCADWSSFDTVAGPETYNNSQFVQIAHLGYSAAITPEYDTYLGQWINPPLNGFNFANYELMLSIPAEVFSIIDYTCGRWYVVIAFKDKTNYEIEDYWTRQDGSTGDWVPYAEIDYTEDPLPVSNSSSFHVNLKSLRIYRLRDKDVPGKDNLVLKWTPINPAFNNDPDDLVFWPGLNQRLGVAWEDKNLGALPDSGIGHSIWKGFWVGMPAHLDHYFLPSEYVEHIRQNSSLKNKGFQVFFQVRTNDRYRIRQVSGPGKVYRTVGKYRKWK